MWPREKILWQEYNGAINNPEKQVDGLINLMEYYFKALGEYKTVDSLSRQSLNIAKNSKSLNATLIAYEAYFNYKIGDSDTVLAQQYISEVERIEPSSRWYSTYFKSKAFFINHKFSDGTDMAIKAIEIANSLNNEAYLLKSLLQAGLCEERDENRVEALEHLFLAESLLPKQQHLSLQYQIFKAIQRLYYLNDNLENAALYWEKQNDVFALQEIIDTADWFETQSNKIEMKSHPYFTQDVKDELISLMQFSKKSGYLLAHDGFWSILRSNLIRTLELEQLHYLYVVRFPEDLILLKTNRTKSYYRLRAYLFEYEKDLDSANYYWELAMTLQDNQGDLYNQAHVKRRYAEYLKRVGETDKAYQTIKEALVLSEKSKFTYFIVRCLQMMVTIEEENGNYKLANTHIKIKDSLEVNFIRKSKQAKLAIIGVTNEYDKKEIIRKTEEEKARIATRNNYFVLIASLFIFIVVSSIIFRQYRLTHLEKEKSEKLLLNILPKQTAKELKAKGYTTAKQYENVTVLFFDVVSFTTIAEKLSPTELVKVIDEYFTLFDKIISKHGLEKIKTVGDAYVAVGGLPDENNASVFDVTNAAIEISKNIKRLKIEYDKVNRPAFQLRIGINTGSVVAGVVGSIKFQFDIWGDAVNTAARMEQNSEPGKINVSKSTYHLIKNDFKCTYRGMINAKNKGKIEMYFVEDV